MSEAGQSLRARTGLIEPDLLRSLRRVGDRRGWPLDHWVWGQVHRLGFGRIYLRPSPDRIIPKSEIESTVSEIKACGAEARGLTMCGAVGTGKTSILCYLAAQFVTVLAQPTAPCLVMLRDTPSLIDTQGVEWTICGIRFIPTGDLFELFFDRERDRINELKTTPVLMLDDFGREYQSDFPMARFENFIEYRYAERLCTFITTNIAPADLARNPGWARIVDRLRDKKWMEILTIGGESIRGK